MLAVTGITGHTGGFFIKELVDHHYQGQIRCLVRTSGKADRIIKSGLSAEILAGSLDNEEDIRALLTGADTVVHIANIHYSPAILRIGKECGVKRFILIHTTGMLSKFKSASREYIEIEDQVAPEMKALNVTILRPTMIFGDLCDYNISKFIRFVDRLPILPVVSGGRSLIQPVNARDLGLALYQVLDVEASFGKAYNLSGERAITIRELYQMIGNSLHKKRLIISLPMWLCVCCAYFIRAVSLGKIDLVEKVQRMGEDRAFSHEAAAADFGYAPESFAVGLQREINEYIAEKQ